MKKLKKSSVALLMSGALLGGVTGYAATNIFGNLDQIRDNYDLTFNFAKSQQQKANDLQQQLDATSNDKTQLQSEIVQLKQDLEQVKNNHATEITDKNAEIQAKQDEINAKQAEVNIKQDSINQLNNEIGELNGQMSQVEAQVDGLLNHTNDRVNEGYVSLKDIVDMINEETGLGYMEEEK